jgi:nucleoid-associated protein YgaU
MKRAIVFFMVLFLSGCLGRTYLTNRNKLDFDPVTGERHAPTNDPKDNEKVMVWEIELNKGKVPPKPTTTAETTTESTYTQTESTQSTAFSTPEPVTEVSATPATTTTASGDKTYTEYTVQKSDTLQKISQKVYGTTKKWQLLYNENKDVLKGPDKLYPGLVIKVPNKQ